MAQPTILADESSLTLQERIDRYYDIDYYVDNVSCFNWADRQVGIDPETESSFDSTIHVKLMVESSNVEDVFRVFDHFLAAKILGLSKSGRAVFFPEVQLDFGF